MSMDTVHISMWPWEIAGSVQNTLREDQAGLFDKPLWVTECDFLSQFLDGKGQTLN
jgi:hypothetical protein